MKKIKVNLDQMEACAGRIVSVSQKEIEEADKMHNIIAALAESWTSADNIEFTNRIYLFLQQLKKSADETRRAGETLKKQRNNYLTRLEANVHAARGL
ncbi:MAG: hypothetical protein LBN08_05630 [Lactobacillales bacterium]|jgi:uncharacterized protein YukE|nr:hypothetical protein [Lactobacillales bacterium]